MAYLDYPGLQRFHGKVQGEIDGLKDDFTKTVYDGYVNMYPVANGTFNADGTYVYKTTRIRTNIFPVSIGDKLEIGNGSLKHACGGWAGDPSLSTNVRNDSQFNTSNKTITFDYDGYFVVAFAKLDAKQTITKGEFDII